MCTTTKAKTPRWFVASEASSSPCPHPLSSLRPRMITRIQKFVGVVLCFLKKTARERYTNTYVYTCIQVQERHCEVIVSRVHEMRTTLGHHNAPSEHRQRNRERRPIPHPEEPPRRHVRSSLLVGQRTGRLRPSFEFFKPLLTLHAHASDHGTSATAIAQTQRESKNRERGHLMRASSQEV